MFWFYMGLCRKKFVNVTMTTTFKEVTVPNFYFTLLGIGEQILFFRTELD